MKEPRLYVFIGLVILVFSLSGLYLWRNRSNTEPSNDKENVQEDSCIQNGAVLQVVDNLVCCSGLTAETFCFHEDDSDEDCSCPSEGTKLCIDCGNGECGPGEDECMCPEDCN